MGEIMFPITPLSRTRNLILVQLQRIELLSYSFEKGRALDIIRNAPKKYQISKAETYPNS